MKRFRLIWRSVRNRGWAILEALLRPQEKPKKYIIYLSHKEGGKTINTVGVAHTFDGKFYWETARYKLGTEEYERGILPTINRLMSNDDSAPREVTKPDEILSLAQLPYRCSIPTKVIVVTEEE